MKKLYFILPFFLMFFVVGDFLLRAKGKNEEKAKVAIIALAEKPERRLLFTGRPKFMKKLDNGEAKIIRSIKQLRDEGIRVTKDDEKFSKRNFWSIPPRKDELPPRYLFYKSNELESKVEVLLKRSTTNFVELPANIPLDLKLKPELEAKSYLTLPPLSPDSISLIFLRPPVRKLGVLPWSLKENVNSFTIQKLPLNKPISVINTTGKDLILSGDKLLPKYLIRAKEFVNLGIREDVNSLLLSSEENAAKASIVKFRSEPLKIFFPIPGKEDKEISRASAEFSQHHLNVCILQLEGKGPDARLITTVKMLFHKPLSAD